MTVEGLIRDVDPAVRRALPIADAAVLKQTGGATDGYIEFETVDLRGEPGMVRIEFEKTDGSLRARREPRTMSILVRAGRFPHPERERDLAERIGREILTFASTR